MSKRKKIKLILAIVFLISGIFLFTYPRITDNIYKSKVDKIEKNFANVTDTSDNRLNELYDLLKNENIRIYNDKQREFLNDKIYEIANINLTEYGLKDNVLGFIEIPSVGIKLPIYLGSSNYNMTLGATHLTGTSYPIGGVNTNSVIAAHRGFYKTKMFRDIDKIQIGDSLYIKNFNETIEYIAVKIDVIKPDELAKLTIHEGKDMITIISCHPFPTNYQRYVVYFERNNI